MKKIIDYHVLENEYASNINLLIKNGISEGYQPYGSPFERTVGGLSFISQALVKYEEPVKGKSAYDILNERYNRGLPIDCMSKIERGEDGNIIVTFTHSDI